VSNRFIGEDDLETFEGWCRYQAFDESTTPEEMRAMWGEVQCRCQDLDRLGRMSLRTPLGNGEARYAVALEEGNALWLALWIRHSAKREFFVLYPRRDRRWNAHTTYHASGWYHSKSHGGTLLPDRQRQPISNAFRGIECLGEFSGYGPKSVGAVCDPADFTDVIRVPARVLGPKHGVISVQLLEPGLKPPVAQTYPLVVERVFRDCVPCLAVSVYDTA
jgi:hypothetical protein